jgi:hypothetical protein
MILQKKMHFPCMTFGLLSKDDRVVLCNLDDWSSDIAPTQR